MQERSIIKKIGEHVSALAQLLDKSSTCEEFLKQQFENDGFEHLFSLILECPDIRTRTSVSMLLKFILVKLKFVEKDYMFEPEDYVIEGDDGTSITMQRHKALSARFLVRGIELFNTQAAKNWNRLE